MSTPIIVARPAAAEPRTAPSPLWATLVFTFIGSLGTGIVTVGLFFIAETAYAFGQRERFLLGLAEGLAYVGGALGAGPAIRRLRRRWPRLSTGGILVGICVMLGALCIIPMVTGAPKDPRAAAHWPIWVLMLTYAPVTGALWPVVESYVSGGRSGQRLRSALGRFNITWSIAVVAGLVVIGPTVKAYAAELIASLAFLHLVSVVLVRRMGREPGRHLHEEHEPHPLVYVQLLTTFRILLPVSYLVFTAFNPYMPTLLRDVGLHGAWLAPFAAMWAAARVLSFVVLERWHGWQGRWYPIVVGVGGLMGGFGVALLAPTVGEGPVARGLLLAGLFGFGCGMALIYTGALYYALEVGNAQVDAGGKHEALIGVGYTFGPICGLAAMGVVGPGPSPGDGLSFEVIMLILVGVIALAAVGYAGWRSWRVARTAMEPGRKEPRRTS